MRKLLRWLGYGVGAVSALLLLAAASVWLLSAQKLNASVPAKPERLAAPTPAQLADAERQARTLGCYSCHGEGMRGNKMFDEPKVGTIWASNVTRVAERATDEQLARAIRQGIGADGRPLFVMQSEVFQHLTDGETAALIGLIRALPKSGADTPPNRYGPVGRIGLALGKFRTAPEVVAEYATREPRRVGKEHDAGHRLAVTKCSGCHGADLGGREIKPDEPAPDLDIAGAYDLPAFKRLLREGVPAGGRKLKLMATIARSDLSHLTDAEIGQLHAYLVKRAETAN